jgi:hypothetical protein
MDGLSLTLDAAATSAVREANRTPGMPPVPPAFRPAGRSWASSGALNAVI